MGKICKVSYLEMIYYPFFENVFKRKICPKSKVWEKIFHKGQIIKICQEKKSSKEISETIINLKTADQVTGRRRRRRTIISEEEII